MNGDGKALFFSASHLEGRPVPSRSWHVEGMLPGRNVTLLSGDGGTGKSLLALQLAIATATGSDWLGRRIEQPGPAMFLSAEDEAAEIHRRVDSVAGAKGLRYSELERLRIASTAGQDALLAVLDRQANQIRHTPLFERLEQEVASIQPSLVVLDTLADLTSGDENNRTHARAFVGMLRGLALRHNCALLLLAHPSVAGMASGTGLSGSTAWNGSVRSRLYLERITDDGHESDPDARRLSTKKANYGRIGGEILLNWRDGVFDAPKAETGLDRMASNAKAERVFLKLLEEFNEEGRRVRETTGCGYAPHAFAKSGRSEGLGKVILHAAMEQLFQKGMIRIAEEGPPSRRVRFLERVAK